jgi:N-acetylglutamate synthase-like GNAT family acetyltransferase
LYLLLDGYPPDIPLPYPPVFVTPGDSVKELNNEDASKEWFKCGDVRIDKIEVGEYLYYQKISKNCRIFVVVEKGKALGILHFYTKRRNAHIETLAVSEKAQGQHIGTKLVNFFLDWCKFNGIRWVDLDAFKERETFYQMLNFTKVREFEIPSYAKFCHMKRKVF